MDKNNHLNILFFNQFTLIEGEEREEKEPDIKTRMNLFYSNEYKIVIITQQLTEGDIPTSYFLRNFSFLI